MTEVSDGGMAILAKAQSLAIWCDRWRLGQLTDELQADLLEALAMAHDAFMGEPQATKE